jgi:hypothetical protein
MEVADKVRKAAPDDLPQISTALSRAFFDDPLFAWALPDDQRRQRLLPEFFALFTRAFLRHHQSYTSTGDVVAAALWAPPGGVPVSGEDAEELGRRIEALAGPGLAGPGHRLGLDGAGAGAVRPRGRARLPGRHQRAQQAAVRAPWLRGRGSVRSSRGAALVADVAPTSLGSVATAVLAGLALRLVAGSVAGCRASGAPRSRPAGRRH